MNDLKKMIVAICILFGVVFVGLGIQGAVTGQEKKPVSHLIIQSKHYDLTDLPIDLFDLNLQNDTLTVCRNITAISVLDLLHEYSVECYADSQKTNEGLMWITVDSLGNWIDSGNDVYWSHRHPTLPGFMAFLEGKYK